MARRKVVTKGARVSTERRRPAPPSHPDKLEHYSGDPGPVDGWNVKRRPDGVPVPVLVWICDCCMKHRGLHHFALFDPGYGGPEPGTFCGIRCASEGWGHRSKGSKIIKLHRAPEGPRSSSGA